MNGEQSDLSAGLDQLRSYWEGRARSRLSDLEKLEWSHQRTQRMRFEAFLQEHDLEGKSVLDIGCGLGDFYAHLRQRGIHAHYTGIDISPSMVSQCRRRYGDARFESGNILEYAPNSRFDYTVAFGIHNIRVAGGRAILDQVTDHQFRLASIAAHVSLINIAVPTVHVRDTGALVRKRRSAFKVVARASSWTLIPLISATRAAVSSR